MAGIRVTAKGFTAASIFVLAAALVFAAYGADTAPKAPEGFVYIAPGTFTMGSPAAEANRWNTETQHTVTLTRGFYMGKHEVTQELYQEVMGANPSYFDGSAGKEPAEGEAQAKRPVENVSWYDAIVFCNKLSERDNLTPVYSIHGSTDPAAWGSAPAGSDSAWNAVAADWGANGYRLPTEAEWEYACRAGTTTAYNTGAAVSDAAAWYAANSDMKTHEVGKKLPNARGLYDMHGNVWEWVWDWSGAYPAGSVTDPAGPESGSFRVLCGGGWCHDARRLRSAYRGGSYPHSRRSVIGFRVVRVAPWSPAGYAHAQPTAPGQKASFLFAV